MRGGGRHPAVHVSLRVSNYGTYLTLAVLMLAWVGTASAQSGFILTAPGTSRASCTAITSPVTNQTWCADGTGAPSTYLWKVWNGTTYITVGGGGGGGGGVCGMSGFVTISGTDTTGTVTFGTPQVDTSYIVSVTTTPALGAPPGVLAWFRNKTVNGFTVELTAAPGAGNSVDVDWIVTFSGGPATCGGAGITGTGTTNTVPLWTSSTTLGNSIIVQPNVTTLELGSLASSTTIQSTLDGGNTFSGDLVFKTKDASGTTGGVQITSGTAGTSGVSAAVVIQTGDGHTTGDIDILVGQTIGGGAFPHAGEIFMQSGFSVVSAPGSNIEIDTGCGTVSCGTLSSFVGTTSIVMHGGASSNNDIYMAIGSAGAKFTLTGANDNTMFWAEDGVTTFMYNQDATGVHWSGSTLSLDGSEWIATLDATDATGQTSLTVYSPNGTGSGGVGSVRILPWGSRTASDGKVTELRFYEAKLSAPDGQYVGFKAPDPIAANVMWTLPATDAVGPFTSNGSGAMAVTAGKTQAYVVCTGAACATSCTLTFTRGVLTANSGTCP